MAFIDFLRGKTPEEVGALIIGSLLVVWGLWWPTTWLKKQTEERLRWGSRRRPGPPMSRFGELAWVLALVTFGAGFSQAGFRGQWTEGFLAKLWLPSFGLLLVALAFDTAAEIVRRKRNPARLALLRQHRRPFKKRAHAYTLSAVAFGFLAFVFIKIALEGWSRFPPKFFGGDGNQLFNAWVPAIFGLLELFLIVQAIRHWLLERAQLPDADYLEYPDEEDSNKAE